MKSSSIITKKRLHLTTLTQNTRINTLLFYSALTFVIRLADAMMAYFSPVYISSHLDKPLIMGLILSSSSVIGLITDFILGIWFSGKRYGFFLFWGITIGALFPLSFLLFPDWIPFFILSMAIWGIYFELLLFSNFHFINHVLDHHHHALGWGILYIFISLSYIAGPFLASFIIETNPNLTLHIALSLYLLSLIIFGILQKKRERHHQHIKITPPPHHFHQQFKIWGILIRSIWPVLLFIFALYILDSIFWTSGAVLSERLKDQGVPGGMLYLVYLLPSIVLGIFADKISRPLGKKRTSFLAGIISGVLFLLSGFASSPFTFIAYISLASVFVAIALPQITGTLEDYIDRLNGSSNNLVALSNSVTSLAYIIGPIFAGLVASLTSHQFSFSVIGFILLLISIITIFFSPRKIKLPQTALQQIEQENQIISTGEV